MAEGTGIEPVSARAEPRLSKPVQYRSASLPSGGPCLDRTDSALRRPVLSGVRIPIPPTARRMKLAEGGGLEPPCRPRRLFSRQGRYQFRYNPPQFSLQERKRDNEDERRLIIGSILRSLARLAAILRLGAYPSAQRASSVTPQRAMEV